MADGSAETGAQAADIQAAVAGRTVPGLLARQCRTRPDEASVHWRDGDTWRAWSWREYGAQVARIAGALERLGFHRGDRAVLLTHPGPEFHVLDSAVLLLGGCPISIYNSSPPERIRHLVAHAGASVVVVADRVLLDRVLAVRHALPGLRHVIVLRPGTGDPADAPVGDLASGTPTEGPPPGGVLPDGVPRDGAFPDGVLSWTDLLEAEPVDLAGRAALARPEDLATVIYTSGTTGLPKGVLLDQRAVLWQCESYRRRLDRDLTGARWISYLPLAHIATRFYAQYCHVYAGLEDVVCPNPADVASVLPDRPPQLFFAPPYLWERFLGELRAWVDSIGDPALADRYRRALELGQRVALHEFAGEAIPGELAGEYARLRPAARELRARLGLGDLWTGAIGAAPANPALLASWIGLGVPMFEGYGLSESTGLLTVDPFAYRPGTVGRPMPGVEVRLDDDGELLFRSGAAFRGYLDDPAQTSAAVDRDGWVRTGDLAWLDDGYVVLRGRKKELLITAGGENVSPVAVEMALAAQPLVGQVCVVGDGQPGPGALVILDPQAAEHWATEHWTTEHWTAEQGAVGHDPADPAEPARPAMPVDLADLAAHPDLLAALARQIGAANETLVRPEKVRRFRVLAAEWLPDSDELTPTAKLRRAQIAAKYAADIAAMFAAPPNVPAAPRRPADTPSSGRPSATDW
ncbi:Long-chain acyl-CoA synthetase (AMP-forming) [Parafrankia irregularis]|uniref:Acyl-CoA synthetase n=1 Tax=Parafrankia irregularis TaxID=795642 RepID=A0A0S4QPJ2_9ACTN|nr:MULTISPECIES: AMP-binding protein [Parafrankia]CUU57145.1 Long-chain acyl-CoA synthetase (AMP-forming) [Parafrankia irregularis]